MDSRNCFSNYTLTAALAAVTSSETSKCYDFSTRTSNTEYNNRYASTTYSSCLNGNAIL